MILNLKHKKKAHNMGSDPNQVIKTQEKSP